MLWKNSEYGDVQLERCADKLKLRKLFGINMESAATLADRVTGLFDVFTSLGSQVNRQVLENVEWREDSLRAEILLYGGRMRYTTEWQYDAALGLIKRSDKITNLSDASVTLHRAVMRFVFAYDEWEAYAQRSGWCYENMGGWNKVQFGGLSLASEGGRTTQGATPFLVLRNPKRRGAAFHLLPNGNWQIDLKTVSRGAGQAGENCLLLEAGQSGEHLAAELAPGAEFCLPELLVQALAGGELSLTAANLQRYFLKTDTDRFRITAPVVYNSWFGSFAVFDDAFMKSRVQTAKELGCEVFVVDAGWYGSQSGDWWSQCGDWAEKTDGAFYGKMGDFAAYVRSQGLGFGLWVEPERIGERTPAYRAHPEYFARNSESGYYYPKLYQPEVYRYIYGEISGLVEKYGLAWMKMDFNSELGEDLTFSEFSTYYLVWYRLLGELKANYPNTFFEGCASGGMRTDMRTVLSYDGHFINDNVNSVDLQFTYEQGALRLPHYRMIKWLVVSPGANTPVYGGAAGERSDSIVVPQNPGAGWDEYERIDAEFACQLIMTGLFGLSGNFTDITPAQRKIFRDHIAFYKKYRDFYKESVLYLGGDPKNVGDRTGFASLQYSRESTDEHLVFTYRFVTACDTETFPLRGLDENADYVVRNALTEEPLAELSGGELMHSGLEVVFPSRGSGKVFLIQKQ